LVYCSGDLFIGDGEGRGGFKDREFRGRPNVDLSLKHFKANLKVLLSTELDSFLLTGESAGGIGAVANYDHIRQTYVLDSGADSDYWTCKDCIMISDSGIPMNDEALTPCLQRNWRERWHLDPSIPQDCTECANKNGGGLGNIWSFLYKKYPTDRFGFLSTTKDKTIALFLAFGRIKYNWFRDCGNYLQPINMGCNFKDGLEDVFKKTVDVPNVCAFVFPGDTHTHTTNTDFWDITTTDALHGNKEVKLTEWYRNVVEGVGMDTCHVENGLY